MAELETLKPCPFCGSENAAITGACPGFYVHCECDAIGPFGRTHAEAVAKWNTRAEVKAEAEGAEGK